MATGPVYDHLLLVLDAVQVAVVDERDTVVIISVGERGLIHPELLVVSRKPDQELEYTTIPRTDIMACDDATRARDDSMRQDLLEEMQRNGRSRRACLAEEHHVVGVRSIICHFVKRSADPHAEILWVKRLRV